MNANSSGQAQTVGEWSMMAPYLCFGFLPGQRASTVYTISLVDIKTSFNYCSSGSDQNSVIPVVCNVPE